MTHDIRFESPDLLHLLWALPLLALLMWAYWRWRKQTLRRLGSPALEQRLLQGFSEQRFWLKIGLFALSVVLVVLALANPTRIAKLGGKTQHSADVLIVLDVSNSMLAKDAPPSRLEQAKNFIQRLVQALEGERIGLVFFAGEAYPQMPLSTDYEALMMFVRNAQPDFITDQGTDIATAVELAGRMLETDKEAGRAIVLVSDGENHEEKALQRVREVREAGVLLYTVGVGLASNALIPAGRGGHRRDFSGQPVRSNANASLMRALAEVGGGEWLNLQEMPQAIQTIKTAVGRLQKSAVESSAATQKIYYFPWLLLPALLFLILEQLLWWRRKEE